MNRRIQCLLVAAVSAFAAGGALAQSSKSQAETLRAQAATESDQGKQVTLLCKAADLEPKNADFRNDCNSRRARVISEDKKSLKDALDAADAGQKEKAVRYAGYVTGLDPDTHQQAVKLIARLKEPAAPAQPVDPSPTMLAQATAAFDAGNLAAARTAAEKVTNPDLKASAIHVLSEIDRYTGLVSAGAHHEEAKEYAAAERSYQSALDLNPHVAGDDLNAKLARVHQLASAPPPPPPSTQTGNTAVAVNNPPPKPVPDTHPKPPPPIEQSMEDKKKGLQEALRQATGRKDLDGEERALRAIVQLDPHDGDAKNNFAAVQTQLTAQLNRDPVRLEKTLRDAITAFYASDFEGAESDLNRYLGADGGKKKGAAYFYLGAIDETMALLETPSKRSLRQKQAQDNFRQARSAGYQPVQKYVSARILEAWQQTGM